MREHTQLAHSSPHGTFRQLRRQGAEKIRNINSDKTVPGKYRNIIIFFLNSFPRSGGKSSYLKTRRNTRAGWVKGGRWVVTDAYADHDHHRDR